MKIRSLAPVYQHQGLPVVVQRALALIALLFAAPLLVAVIVAIKVESKGGCFYKQVRVGRFGRYFTLYKFRSMYLPNDPRYKEPQAEDSDRKGVCQKFKQDPRVSCVGRFIRKYSIDEIPQLWNIARGDMVLIGPRPALITEVADYSDLALSRLNALPGLSGLWQVSGRADTDFDTQIGLDLSYINRQSCWLDLKIIFATIPCVLFAKGAY